MVVKQDIKDLGISCSYYENQLIIPHNLKTNTTKQDTHSEMKNLTYNFIYIQIYKKNQKIFKTSTEPEWKDLL